MNSFLTKKYIILKMINHITEKLRTQCEIFQKFSLSSILYIFYNVDFIEQCTNFSLNISVSDFINDAAIIAMNDIVEDNLKIFRIVHEACAKWFKIHESSFVLTKYELVHFRRLFSSSNSKMILRLFDHDLTFSSKCKYLEMIMNSQFTWKHHLKHFEKKSIDKFSILTALTDSIWKVNTKDLKRTYFVTVLFQFIFCASIWFVLNEDHDFKQRKKTTLTFMKSIQAKATKIISKAFRSTAKTALNVKLHLLSIQNQMNIALYDVMLKIIISSIYFHIKIQKTQSNRQLFSEQTQHQKNLYAQLNPLHKLETRYFAVFKKDLTRLKTKFFYSVVSWIKSSEITLTSIAKEIIKAHDAIRTQSTSLAIYTDENGMKIEINVSTMTVFIFIDGQISMMIDKHQAFLKLFIEYTIYSDELIDLDLTMNIVNAHFETITVNIFIDNQTVIRTFRFFRQQSNQYIFKKLIKKISDNDKIFHIHWISVHVSVFENETTNEAVKKITNWKFFESDSRVSIVTNSKIFISAVRSEIRIRAKKGWTDKWKNEFIERIFHKLINVPTKNVFKKFKTMTRSKNSIIVQVRTNKIDLRNYLFKIKIVDSSTCFCGHRKQTVQHTLFECFGFEKLRKKMWSNKRETNLIKLLNVFILIVKASKFLLNTGELFQYKYFNEVRTESNDDEIYSENETWMKDDW